MREDITITGLLNKIKIQKRKVLEIDHKFLDPIESKNSKSLVSLYNKSRKTTLGGLDIEKAEFDIKDQFSDIMLNILLLRNLLIIKEQVNSTFKLVVPDILNQDKDVSLSIAQILILKSPMIKEYYFRLADRFKNDLTMAKLMYEKYNNDVFDEQKINSYVLAKVNSLQSDYKSDYTDLTNLKMVKQLTSYNEYAKEYIDANSIDFLDPLELENNSNKWYDSIHNFYDSIDTKLVEFNSTTQIWIDLYDGAYGSWGTI